MEKKIAALLAFILGVHGLASIYSWYWVYPWLDIPMHFLGGVFAAVFFLYLTKKYPGQWEMPRNFFIRLVYFLSFVALIGVLWEFSEFLYDITISSRGWSGLTNLGPRDMIGDLFFDLLGGLMVVVVDRLRYNKTNSQ